MINNFKIFCLSILLLCISHSAHATVAKEWNEALLDAIRLDFARPTVHARNLYHTSAVMWDAWATYDDQALGLFFNEKHQVANVAAARHESISYAAYRLLLWRFGQSPNVDITLPALSQLMTDLGYDINVTTTVGNTPAAIGNRIAANMIAYGMSDGANEANAYENQYYLPVNDPLLPDFTGNPDIGDPNRWQPLALDFFIGQSGIIVGEYPDFLSPEWGTVAPFSLRQDQAVDYVRDGELYRVYLDPGAPPYLGTATDAAYKSGFTQVVEWSSYLDPTDGVMVDISPGARGNNALGTNNGTGRSVNPITGQPYASNIVPAGDYYRVLAEFWADGPDSETPPGHWFTILNYVTEQITDKQIDGVPVDDLEWDVKSYLALGGGMHDVAISAWGIKGWYDYIRPVSAIRYMCDQGQSSDANQASYDVNGIPLMPGIIEVITQASIAPGERHEHLAGNNDENVGAIAVNAWRGPDYITEPETDVAGVGWILCGDWWPYQRPSFVTPPFAGYVSGHSTYSRAAAEILTLLTGSEFFPGGMGTFSAPANEFLVFEDGPSVDIELQWATYQDAADECSLSRIYGGIHPTADDIPGRFIGNQIGRQAYQHALNFFRGGAIQPQMVPVNQYTWILFALIWVVGICVFSFKWYRNMTDSA